MNIETAKRLRTLADRLERDERAGAERHGDNELLTLHVLDEVFGIEFWSLFGPPLFGPPPMPSLYGTPDGLMGGESTTRADYLGIDRRIYPMSATIKWEPVEKKFTTIEVGAPSAFIGAMTRAYGHSPWTLTKDDRQKLEGMAAAVETDSERKPYEEILDRLNYHDAIRVWSEY